MSLLTNLVAYYNLDGNSNDSTGTYNGTDHSVSYNSSYGKIGQGIALVGSSSQYISIGSNLGLSTVSSISFSCWAYRAGSTDHGAFFKIGNASDPSGGDGFAFGIGGSGSSGFETAGSNIIVLWEGIRWIDTGVTVGTGWHHYSLVINSSGKPAVYLDGTSIYSDSSTNAAAIGSVGTSIAQIGGYTSSSPSNRFFTGYLDEIGIWSRALTATEVGYLYGGGSGLAYPFGALTTSLVAAWKFDESSGNASDSVGAFTLTNNGTTPYAAGKFSNGANFGTSNTTKYFDRADTVFLDENIDFSLSCWIKPATTPAVSGDAYPVAFIMNQYQIDEFSPLIQQYVYLSYQYDTAPVLFAQSNYTTGISYSVTLTLGTWYHLVVTSDATTVTFYVNGVSVGTNSVGSPSLSGFSSFINMGGASLLSKYFDGMVDETLLYHRALTPEEVELLYANGSGLAWPFNGTIVRFLTATIMNAASRFATISRLGTFARSVSASIMNSVSRLVTVGRGISRTLSDSILNASSRFATVSKLSNYLRAISDSVINSASRFSTVSRVASYSRAISDSIINAASRLATVGKSISVILSDAIMNGASRFATILRVGTFARNISDSIMNAADRFIRLFTPGYWSKVIKNSTTFTTPSVNSTSFTKDQKNATVYTKESENITVYTKTSKNTTAFTKLPK